MALVYSPFEIPSSQLGTTRDTQISTRKKRYCFGSNRSHNIRELRSDQPTITATSPADLSLSLSLSLSL